MVTGVRKEARGKGTREFPLFNSTAKKTAH